MPGTLFPITRGISVPGINRVENQEFRRIRVLLNQFAVFLFQATLKIADIAWFRYAFQIKGNRFNKVIAYVHHQLHIKQDRIQKKKIPSFSSILELRGLNA